MRRQMKFFLNLLDFFFARKILYKTNLNFLKLFIRFLGYNNHKDLISSGEVYFLQMVCSEKPKLCIDIGANVGNYSKYLLDRSICIRFFFLKLRIVSISLCKTLLFLRTLSSVIL